MNVTLVEQICGLDIEDNVFRDDNYFQKRLQHSHGIAKEQCVSLRDCLPSKSQQQAVVTVIVSPISSRGDNCYLLSDLHGVTARLIFGPDAARHHVLDTMRSKGGAAVVLLSKPVVTYDATSRNCQLYIDIQTQMELVGKARFFGRCGAQTKSGGSCRVAVDKNFSDKCHLHIAPVPGQPRGLEPSPAQLEADRKSNELGVNILKGNNATSNINTGTSSNALRSSTSGGTIPLTKRVLPTAGDAIRQARRLGQPSAEGMRIIAAANAAAAIAASAIPTRRSYGSGASAGTPLDGEGTIAALNQAGIVMKCAQPIGIKDKEVGRITAAAATVAAAKKRERDPLAEAFAPALRKQQRTTKEGSIDNIGNASVVDPAAQKAIAAASRIRTCNVTAIGLDSEDMGTSDDDGIHHGSASAAQGDTVRVPEPTHSVFDRGLDAYRRKLQTERIRGYVSAQAGHTLPRSSDKSATYSSSLSHARTQSQKNPNTILALAKAKSSTSVEGNTSSNRSVGISQRGHAGLRQIGGILVDITALKRNADDAEAVSSKKKVAEMTKKKDASKAALDADIAALLSRASSHAQEARDAAFEESMERVEGLERREYMQNKNASVTSVKTRCYLCLMCKQWTEDSPSVCYKKAHTVHYQLTTKRFWVCGRCHYRENTLDGNSRTPKRSCPQCNAYDWKPCGSQGSGDKFESKARGIQGDRLVVAAADGTTMADKLNMAARVSNIDSG